MAIWGCRTGASLMPLRDSGRGACLRRALQGTELFTGLPRINNRLVDECAYCNAISGTRKTILSYITLNGTKHTALDLLQKLALPGENPWWFFG